MKRVLISIVCITLVITLLCLAGAPDEAAAQKDTVVVGLEHEPGSLDPAICYNSPCWTIVSNVYEKLITYRGDDPTQPIPGLAASWDLAADGRTWIFHVRKGATFASGNPVNADAVVFSLRRIVKLAGDSSYLLTQFGITEDAITKIDAETVQIVLADQYAPTLFLPCLAGISVILDPEVVLAHEQDGDLGRVWLEDHSAGSGLYTIEERQGETLVVLKANESYWGPKPAFERVIMKSIGEAAEHAALLQAGELDIARHLLVEDIQTLESHPEVQIVQTWDSFIAYLAMNLKYKPFASPEVRDALRYAIDYDGIIDYVLGGTAVKHQNIQPKGYLGYTPATPYTRDVEKAKQLLADGGYSDGFEVELKCFEFSPYLELAMKLKDDLAAIGLKVHLIPMNADQFLEAYTQRRDFQMYLSGWWPDYGDPSSNAQAFAFCDSTSDDATIKTLAWGARYVNPETSTLVEQAAREIDTEKRRVLYERINEIIVDDGPFIFLYAPIRYYAVRPEVMPFINDPKRSDTFPILK